MFTPDCDPESHQQLAHTLLVLVLLTSEQCVCRSASLKVTVPLLFPLWSWLVTSAVTVSTAAFCSLPGIKNSNTTGVLLTFMQTCFLVGSISS